MVEKIILRYGIFNTLKTDRGTEFMNDLMTRICKLLKITHSKSTAYHHETLGSIERNHRELNEYMLAFTDNYNWDEFLPYYAFAYNTAPHTTTGYSPFELVFGKLATLPNEIHAEQVFFNFDDYLTELKTKLQHAYLTASRILGQNKVTQKVRVDNHCNYKSFNVGDLILLKVGNRRKNDSPYIGPYTIRETRNVNSVIELNGKIQEVHNNRLKLFKHTISN